jgi:DNA-binding GntR family transcriptional regulator
VEPEKTIFMAVNLDRDLGALERRARAFEPERTGESLRRVVVLPILREAIVAGDLLPGARLSEVEIARALGVSRTPIREALGELEREGLVTVFPRLGAFVRTITERDVDEIYTVRESLDVLAAKLVAQRITAVGAAQLGEAVETMRAAIAHGDPGAYVEALDGFYALVMRLSGNETLERIHHSLLGPVRRLRRIAMMHEGRIERSFAQAELIAHAIAAHDPAAADLMRDQIAAAHETVLETVRDIARHAAGDAGPRR